MSVYACSDLHGMGDLWDQIKNYLKPNDTLYFLGDAIDRGPDGWRIVKEMLADPRVIYIKGNHEDMMVKALRSSFFGHRYSEDMVIWDYNGNDPTYVAFFEDPDKEIINKLDNLPFMAVYHNYTKKEIILSHAGYTPYKDYEPDEEDLLWGRSHFYNTKEFDPNILIVHGHTPVIYLEEELQEYEAKNDIKLYGVNWHGAYWYDYGLKVDLDCGSAFTGRTVLFNLNTYEFIPFETTKGVIQP